MNTITEKSYEAKERVEGAGYILHALTQRQLYIFTQNEWKDREEFILAAGDMYPYETATAQEVADMRELMDAADKFFAEGYRLVHGARHDATLTFSVPKNALAWRVVTAGYIATSEQGRLEYVIRQA